MIRTLVMAALVGAVFCVPINYVDEIPAEYKALIPDEVAGYLKELTPADREALKAVVVNFKNYKTEYELLEALKAKNPETYEKMKKLHAFISEKVENLGPEAKEFVQKSIVAGRALHRKFLAGQNPDREELKVRLNSIVAGFNELSEAGKAELRSSFPIITVIFKNEKFQQLVKTFLGAEN